MNINEIAKLAGVSRATVSRYLNQGYVSEEKREKIKEVIQKTGYQPSFQAQMLRTKKTKLIGVIIPKINSDTVSRMVAGISMVLSKHGFELLLANTNNDENEELKYLELFKDNRVDGVILIGTIFTKKHVKILKNYMVPVVILGQRLKGYSCVYHDDYHAAKDLTKILLQKGNRVGYIGVTPRDEAAGKQRREGYISAFEEEDKSCPIELMLEAKFSIESGYNKTKELLQLEPNIEGIFCATDSIAMGAMMYLREIKRTIPYQIQLVGVGDTTLSQIALPKLTTVHFYYKTSGIEATNMLIELLSSEDAIKKELKMGYEVIKRDSTIPVEEKK